MPFRPRSRNRRWNFQSPVNDSAWGISRCKTHYLPGAEYAMWVRCSPGTLEDALHLRSMSIMVPPTTLSAIGLDLGQQPVRGSQPRDLPIRQISPGPFHPVLRCLPPLSSASGHRTHTSPRFPTIPFTPRPQKELVGPTGFLKPRPDLHTTCCAIMSCPFASAPAWAHNQGQEECERQSEECRSIPGHQTFLVVSPSFRALQLAACHPEAF